MSNISLLHPLPKLCVALFLCGCASFTRSDFEVAVVSGDEMPEAWRQSVDAKPYFSGNTQQVGSDAGGVSELGNDEADTPPPRNRGTGRPVVAKQSDLPYGTPAPGQAGLVRSPYSAQGLVDVSGYSAGFEVKCPYTGKVFLVP